MSKSAALVYAGMGYPVFPCRIDKRPMTPNGFKDATIEPEMIRAWWEKRPEASIGIPTGQPSGFVVLDVDAGSGGIRALDELTHKYGELPDTPMAFTGGGGYHYFFNHIEGLRNSAGKLGPGLDIRADGGYVIVPPSGHPSGKRYQWELSSVLGETPLSDMPDWILDQLVEAKKEPIASSGVIPEGQREDALVRLAGGMRRLGADADTIYPALDTLNKTRCQPSLPDEAIKRIAKSVQRYKVEEPIDENEAPNDVYNGRQIIRHYGDVLRYCEEFNAWYIWSGTHWAKDRVSEVYDYARAVLKLMAKEGIEKDDTKLVKHAIRSGSHRAIQAMLGEARTMSIRTKPEDFDRHLWLLNCPNGTLDLRTLAFTENNQDDMITKCTDTDYNPEATCELWLEFLDQIMPSQEMIDFLQRAVGYSLIGEVQEKVLLIPWGQGDNGKSTFIETLAAVIGGDYAMRTPTELFLTKREGAIPNDVAQLKGIRFAYAAEPPQDRRLGEALIKELTGGDTMSARFMRGEFFTFQPECTLWMATNHKPPTRGNDQALWNRIKLIPFDQIIKKENQDRGLKGKLLSEREGILAWAIRGAVDWYENGLQEPDEVKVATDTYRGENDTIGSFLAEKCDMHQNYRSRSSELYSLYRAFTEEAGERPVSQKMFSQSLIKEGFEVLRNNGTWFIGVGIVRDND